MSKLMVGFLIFSLGTSANASQSPETVEKALTAALAIQLDLSVTQKQFSVLSRGLSTTENCVARELLDTSIDFRQVTGNAITLGRILGEMKSEDDKHTVRRHLGIAIHQVSAVGENDIELVDALSRRLTTPSAIEAASVLREKMAAIRSLLIPFASDRY